MKNLLSGFPAETLILHKKSGETQTVPALVDDDTIYSDDIDIIIEEGDIYGT